MGGSVFLTLFLFLGGVFTVWCAYKNYDWYFLNVGLAGKLIWTVGRKIARVFFLTVGTIMLVWGTVRLVKPPPSIPVDFIYELGRPSGIDLVSFKEAAESLNAKNETVFDLESDDDGWVSFWAKIDPESPIFGSASLAADAGPDFSEGFAISDREINGKALRGRILYFDKNLQSCDHVLFSKKPLKSAVFAIVICSKHVSPSHTGGRALVVYYFRSGTDIYRKVTRF